jgi:hypothetical protein
MTPDLDTLEKLARGASPKWKDADDWSHDHYVGYYLPDEDAAYIAAVNPQTILSLIAALRGAEVALEKQRRLICRTGCTLTALKHYHCNECEEANKTLTRTRAMKGEK